MLAGRKQIVQTAILAENHCKDFKVRRVEKQITIIGCWDSSKIIYHIAGKKNFGGLVV